MQDCKEGNMTITTAQTILEQLGGSQFVALIGARNFVRGENYLQFRMPRVRGQINCCRVIRTGLDLYDLEFSEVRGGWKAPIGHYNTTRHENLYAENLRALFERETGLRTSLTRAYGG